MRNSILELLMDLWQEMLQTLCLTGGQQAADPSAFVKFYLSVFVLLSLSGFVCKYHHSLQGRVVQERWLCLSKYRRNLRLFCKVDCSAFPKLHIISASNPTLILEKIFVCATDIVLFSQCGWDREVPIQRSLTQF